MCRSSPAYIIFPPLCFFYRGELKHTIKYGFSKSKRENGEKIQYKLKDGDITIGCSFTAYYPRGRFWAKKDGADALLPDEEVKDLPAVQRFYNIREGKEQMPEAPVAQPQPQLLLQLPGPGKEKLTLIKDLHYYERDGKLIFGKEGELKLAAQSENRVKLPRMTLSEKKRMVIFILNRNYGSKSGLTSRISKNMRSER